MYALPPAPAPTPIAFDVHGYAEVRTGIRGRVAIDGTFSGQYDASSHAFSGAFSLTPTVARIKVLGLVDATAETDWIFTEPVSGAWQNGVLTLRAAARIHHPHLYAFGNVPIAGGARCATRQPSVLELASDPADPVADPFDGGTLATSAKGFTISGLSGCGVLDGVLSAIAAGGGNQASLTLTRRAA